jgi:hypothetical protein
VDQARDIIMQPRHTHALSIDLDVCLFWGPEVWTSRILPNSEAYPDANEWLGSLAHEDALQHSVELQPRRIRFVCVRDTLILGSHGNCTGSTNAAVKHTFVGSRLGDWRPTG